MSREEMLRLRGIVDAYEMEAKEAVDRLRKMSRTKSATWQEFGVAVENFADRVSKLISAYREYIAVLEAREQPEWPIERRTQ